jgi:Tol biopolymer transport system component
VFAAGNNSAGNSLDTLYEKPYAGGSDEKEILKVTGKQLLPSSWSHDGRFLLYYSSGVKTMADIWVLPLEGDRKPTPLLATEFNEVSAVFSPDMRWIAYVSNESGRYEVYVRPFTASGPGGAPSLGEGKWQISKDGGSYPRWVADGRQILFEAVGGMAVMAADIKANGASFEAGVPQRLFQAPPASDYAWDVTADGKRIVLAAPQGEQTGPVLFNVVLNWPALLKKN